MADLPAPVAKEFGGLCYKCRQRGHKAEDCVVDPKDLPVRLDRGGAGATAEARDTGNHKGKDHRGGKGKGKGQNDWVDGNRYSPYGRGGKGHQTSHQKGTFTFICKG